MTPALLAGIGLVGGIGAVARFLLDTAVSERTDAEFPYGTLAVNLLGSLALGFLTGAALDPNADKLLGTGLIGAFTTFSTWMLETHRLGEDGRLRAGGVNLVVSLVLGLGAAWLGRRIGVAL